MVLCEDAPLAGSRPLHRLYAEIIAIDLAAAALTALERALRLEHVGRRCPAAPQTTRASAGAPAPFFVAPNNDTSPSDAAYFRWRE